MRPYRPQGEQSFSLRLEIGYYPVRSKAQLPRLLCQYLHIDYLDRFFTPDQWSRFKQNQARQWTIRDLPFLRDGQFVVTGPSAMIVYIVEKAGRSQLLGRNLADKVRIDSLRSKHDLKSAIEGLVCAYQEDNDRLMQIWASRIEPILKDIENDCPKDGWYLEYFSIMDFVVYELLGLISTMFPDAVSKFGKLKALRERFSSIPQIKTYQNSKRAVRQYSPVAYFSKFKEQKLRTRTQMEIE